MNESIFQLSVYKNLDDEPTIVLECKSLLEVKYAKIMLDDCWNVPKRWKLEEFVGDQWTQMFVYYLFDENKNK
jgi:hypothetical protein